MARPAPVPPLFPYTTLFRSHAGQVVGISIPADGPIDGFLWRDGVRSEEHTSELQSLTNLVCRLLLEKKNARGTVGAGHSRRGARADGCRGEAARVRPGRHRG